MSRSRVIPAIVALWGALIVLRLLASGVGPGAYGTGELFGGIAGFAMLVYGVRGLLKQPVS
jgi:hypothetical protein